MPFLTNQSWCVLKSWYTGGAQNKDFGAVWQTDRLNQSLVSSIAQTTASKLDTTYSTDFQLSAVIPNRTRSLADQKSSREYDKPIRSRGKYSRLAPIVEFRARPIGACFMTIHLPCSGQWFRAICHLKNEKETNPRNFSQRFLGSLLGTHYSAVRELKQRRRGRKRERQKSNRFRLAKTTTLHVHHACLYISLPSLHDYSEKVPNFTFCPGRGHKTITFFSFPELWYSLLEFKYKKNWLTFDE